MIHRDFFVFLYFKLINLSYFLSGENGRKLTIDLNENILLYI